MKDMLPAMRPCSPDRREEENDVCATMSRDEEGKTADEATLDALSDVLAALMRLDSLRRQRVIEAARRVLGLS